MTIIVIPPHQSGHGLNLAALQPLVVFFGGAIPESPPPRPLIWHVWSLKLNTNGPKPPFDWFKNSPDFWLSEDHGQSTHYYSVRILPTRITRPWCFMLLGRGRGMMMTKFV